MANNELKPCPFCGGAVKLFGGYGGGAAAINCTMCDAYGPSVLGKDAAIAAWNRRAAPAQGGLSDALERIAEGWDGCMYEAPGENLDIGADLRRSFSRIRGQQGELSDAARYREWRAAMCREDEKFMDDLVNALPSRLDVPDGSTATDDEWDAAIDAAIQARAKDKK